ncbi:MAG: AAA family ATPase [Desulfobacterales bacterium]|nr:AAA family ATPase [Desulfobacterales bacterium]
MSLSSLYQTTETLFESDRSTVYRGKQKANNQPVVIKILNEEYPSPAEIARFIHEYEIIKDLETNGIIKIFNLEKYNNSLAIIMEDIGGNSLKNILLKGQLDVKQFLEIAINITKIISEIHQHNIIHKDINLSNIIWNPHSNQIRIIDFGIATELSEENVGVKNVHILEGTLQYISPEQTGRMNRVCDYRTDYYSLGISFYEMLCGNVPFMTDDPMELIHSHIARNPQPIHEVNPSIPKIVSDIIMKLIAKNADDRYQSAFGIITDLDECLKQLKQGSQLTDFPIGARDVSDKFNIPKKLYGREKEVETLLNSFERISKGKAETILVSGFSGIGKSFLVYEIHKPIVASRGYFISGKFDQFQRNIPYSALIQAFNELCQQLLTESKEKLTIWREKLLNALGTNARVIIDVIPDFELITGHQPPVPFLGPTESQNRFNFVFENFIQVFTQKEHPLVLFLDDLQWADSATLNMLNILITAEKREYFLLIGAYRDNEIDMSHPLSITIEQIKKETPIISLSLCPLEKNHVNQLLADTLHHSPNSVEKLGNLILNKTDGNPFFYQCVFKKSLP